LNVTPKVEKLLLYAILLHLYFLGLFSVLKTKVHYFKADWGDQGKYDHSSISSRQLFPKYSRTWYRV